MPQKISEKLFDRLIELDLSPAAPPKRVRAGRHQRSAGGWLWHCLTTDWDEIGSLWTMEACVKAKNITVLQDGNDHELIVED